MSQEIDQEETFKLREINEEDPNAVYVEFNPEIALEKLINLEKLKFNEKQSYTRHLAELIGIIGDKGLRALPGIFQNYIKESQQIKRQLIQQITPLVNYIQSNMQENYEFKYRLLIDSFVPLLSSLLLCAPIHVKHNHINAQLKESSGSELALLSSIFSDEDRGKYILTVVLGMAHDDLQEDNRIVAVQLLSKMANSFGKDLCEQFVGLEFLSLGEDPQIKVRKEAVMHLPIISKVVSLCFVRQKLIPFYMRVSQDNVWIVRKACVDVLEDMFSLAEPEVQQQQLVELMLAFLKDGTKWVKIAAYKQLGKVIVQLKEKKNYDKLLEYYFQMVEPQMLKLGNGYEMMESCAFNFPAVLWATYTEQNWPSFYKLYKYMLQNGDNKVRQPLVCSLHEIAKLIGPQNAEVHLFPVLDKVFNENTELKYGAIKHLSEFLEIFTDEKRDNLVDIFLHLQKDHPNQWRIRELIADQIGNLSEVYRPETLFKIIAPISFKLCNDNVSLVRYKASLQIKNILARFNKCQESTDQDDLQFYKECLIQNVIGFSLSTRYTQRQTFIYICQGLVADWPLFSTFFLQAFHQLSTDKVVNVRITLIQVLLAIYLSDKEVFPQELSILVKQMHADHYALQHVDRCIEIHNALIMFQISSFQQVSDNQQMEVELKSGEDNIITNSNQQEDQQINNNGIEVEQLNNENEQNVKESQDQKMEEEINELSTKAETDLQNNEQEEKSQENQQEKNQDNKNDDQSLEYQEQKQIVNEIVNQSLENQQEDNQQVVENNDLSQEQQQNQELQNNENNNDINEEVKETEDKQ